MKSITLSRRGFLNAASGVSAGLAIESSLSGAEPDGHRRLKEIGIIRGVPKDMAGDWKKSLRRMSEIGYTILEGGPRGTSPQEYLAFLNEIGLRLVSCGVRFGKKLAPDWLDQAKALKVEYATTFWPWFYSPSKLTLSQLKEITDQLNLAGKHCKAAGLKFAVHNHYQEFEDLDGKPIFDHLLDMTDPDLVTIEMDLCWAVKGNADPVDYFRRYPKRIEMLHVKDLGPAPDYAMVPVGAGTIDFARIFAAAQADGVKYYIVELEGAANTTQAAADSHRYLSQLTF
jgi:sugar phosphate isomerase/epimerase